MTGSDAGDGVSPLAPRRVAELLAGTPAETWRVTGGVPTASTMDDARALAAAGDPGPVVVLATAQSAGRGRLGRAWGSPAGGVYFSLLLKPAISPDALGPLPLVAGLGVAEGLDSAFGVRVTVKWPNDLRVRGVPGHGDECASPRKLGGILVESGVSGGRVDRVVVGCGLDVTPPESPADRAPGAAYLAELLPAGGPAADPAVVAAAALAGLAGALERFRRSGFEALASAYEARSDIIGTEVTVRDAAGDPVAHGTVVRFDRAGHLVLSSEGREVFVAAGEVTLRE
jgi:BirA family biotin operon repressor/biotin-[acetyl-CoA-carboxylase] ligase